MQSSLRLILLGGSGAFVLAFLCVKSRPWLRNGRPDRPSRSECSRLVGVPSEMSRGDGHEEPERSVALRSLDSGSDHLAWNRVQCEERLRNPVSQDVLRLADGRDAVDGLMDRIEKVLHVTREGMSRKHACKPVAISRAVRRNLEGALCRRGWAPGQLVLGNKSDRAEEVVEGLGGATLAEVNDGSAHARSLPMRYSDPGNEVARGTSKK